ncbi:flagellar motor switch protein FliG [Paracoccus litorisediminis]|uniref:flagellar motor switch protein FliG n=1 Tax=Paracoccus litorisediminis TaxID=2006130 RepID=UPI003733FB6B
MQLVQDNITLRGPEKAAVLFLCLQEEKGSELMRELTEDEVQILTQAMATLGTIPANVVEGVIREFAETMAGGGGVMGSAEAARRLLASFLPDSRVAEIMNDIHSPNNGRSIWENFGALNEQVIANYMMNEHDQTIAAVMSKVRPDVAARVLPLFGVERMTDITVRMFRIDTLPRHTLEDIEEAVATEFLPAATRKSGADSQQRMADILNKMDTSVFDPLSRELEERAPEEFAAVKAKMFTFDDLARLDKASLQRVMRSVDGKTLSVSLRGAKKPVRDAFMEALTQRAREMLQEEMEEMGPIRARDVRVAQTAIIDVANDLARQEIIRLPTDDEVMI